MLREREQRKTLRTQCQMINDTGYKINEKVFKDQNDELEVRSLRKISNKRLKNQKQMLNVFKIEIEFIMECKNSLGLLSSQM